MSHTLLLADDSVTIQRVIELTFADEDVVVVAVSDGDQAIARLEASPPDIVLADIGMPGKNGYEVAQYIRQSPRLAHIPVVLLTGAFEPVDEARAAAAGCDGVLAKPFEPQLVIGRVKELLARKRRAPEAIAADGPPPLVSETQWAPPPAEPRPTAPAPAAPPLALDDYFDRLDAAFSTMSPPASPPQAAPAAPAPPAGPDIDWFTMTAGGAPAAQPWDLPVPADLAEFADRSEPANQAEPQDLRETFTSPPPASPVPPFELETADAPVPQAHSAEPAAFDAGAAYAQAPSPADLAAASANAAAVAPFAPDRRWPPPQAEVAAAAPPAAATPAAAAVPSAPAAPARPAALPALADAFAALLAAEQGEPLPADAPAWPASSPGPVDTDALVDEVARRVLDRLSDQVVRDTVAGIVSKVAEQLVRDEIDKIKASLK
jgi:CheY-like chemotaxis protein